MTENSHYKVEKFNQLIYFGLGSSTGHPDFEGLQTCDLQLWVKFNDYDWFRPYGDFGQHQILLMIDICENVFQLKSLMGLLSVKKINLRENYDVEKED